MRLTLIAAGTILGLTAVAAFAGTDWMCRDRCLKAQYSYAYCDSVCSYPDAGAMPPPPQSTMQIPRPPQGGSWQALLPRAPQMDIGRAFIQGQRDAAADRQSQAQSTAQSDLARAQQEYIEEQTRALRLENDRKESEASGTGSGRLMDPSERLLQMWLAAAQPRMHLYPDFQQVVYAKDVIITEPMIEWMAASMYAADIAYFLGSNKAEAERISRLDSVRLAQEMRAIEAKFIGQQ